MENAVNQIEKVGLLGNAIEKFVRPDTFPLGIRVMKEGEELPEKVRRPLRDLGSRFSICQAITMSRRYGWALAMGSEDQSCPIAKVAFAYEDEVDFYSGGNLAHGMYAKTCEIGVETENAVPKFAKAEAGTIVIAPLNRATFEPQIVVTYGNSAQVMRMVAASLYTTGGEITSHFSARADCADIIIRTMQSDKPQVILPCYGDRVFGQTHDHEMAFSFPYSGVASFMEGLEGTHRGGVRYPVPTFLRYENQYPATYERLNDMFDDRSGN